MTTNSIVKAERAALVNIAGNLGLALIKGVFGWLSGSSALTADAVHTAAAGIRMLSIMLRLREETPQPSRTLSQGSKKYFVLAVFASALVLVIGVELGLAFIETIRSQVTEPPKAYAIWIILGSVIVSEGIRRMQMRRHNEMYPHLRKMISREHIPSLVSSLVVLLGAGGALAGRWLDLPWLYYLDSAGGLVISLLVIRTGYRILLESRIRVMGEVLEPEDKGELLRTVQRVKGVIAVDDLKVHEQGHFVLIDLRISVNPEISVQDGNEIAKMVKHHLMKRFMHIADVVVSVQPYDGGYPYKNNLDREEGQMPMLH